MLTTITIIILIAAIVVLSYFLYCFSERIDDLKLDLEVTEQVSESKQARIEVLIEKEKNLLSRVQTYSMGITRFKREDTDIRVLQVYARDELAIELQKDGLITYKMKENWREDLQETEVSVTASINVNKIK